MSKVDIAWHTLTPAQVLKKLNTSKQGLSDKDAKKNLDKYGLNILAKAEKFSAWRLFLSQFKSALVYVLLIAGIISFFFGEFVDAYVIFAAVLLNVIVGFLQEFKANKSLEKLNKVVKKESIVLRDGHEKKITSNELVPGDIILLKSGDRVPADAYLLEINDFEVNEASLTGESWPVKKKIDSLNIGTVLAERSNMVFMGTLIVEGRGLAVVISTGLDTEMGKITKLLKDTKEERTPLQKKLDSFAKNITKIIIVIVIFLFLLGISQGYDWVHMFTMAVAVAVSAIPEGLIISMTMILTVGMQRILKQNGLVRKLVSAETLGSTTVICTDKTGTLTEGEMRVTELITASHQVDLAVTSLRDMKLDEELNMLGQISFLCNDSVVQNPDERIDDWLVIGSPTEKALLLFGSKMFNIQGLDKKYFRIQEVPFDSKRKYMITRHNFDSKQDIIFIKGAPEKILDFSDKYINVKSSTKLTKQKKDLFNKKWEDTSKKGLRVLGGAFRMVSKSFKDFEDLKEKPEGFTFVGIWGLADPLRPNIKSTLAKTFSAGIKTVIITGDNKFTANKIAEDLGIDVNNNSVVTGDELLNMTDDQLADRIKDIKVYARVTPADKLRIINAWQKKGEIVSMTGDGVNDAPALKAADIGVAVSSGSDIAKETADLVLLDNNFETIVMSIKQGRVIFANIRKVILYLLSDSFSEVLIIVGSIVFHMPLPILAAQILWVNLVDDGFPALALTMEPEDEYIMNQKPKKEKKLLDFEGKFIIALVSIITGLSSLGLFYYYWKTTNDLDLARTVAFSSLALSTLFYVFSIKNLDYSIFKNPFKNRYLNVAVIVGIFLQLIAVYVPFFNKALRTIPLNLDHWQLIFIVIILVMVLIELVKWIFIIYYKKHKA